MLNAQLTRLLEEQKRLQDLMKGTAEPPTKPVSLLGGDDSGSGSKSGPKDTTAQLQAAIAAQQVLLQIEQERFGLTERELELRQFDDERRQAKAALEKELIDIQGKNITDASKLLEVRLAELKYATDLQQIKNEQRIYEEAIKKEIEDQLRDLEYEILIEEAVTEELKEQIRLRRRLEEIQNGPGSQEDKDRLKDAEERLKKAREGNQGISGYMKRLEAELKDTEGMIVSLAQTIEGELGRAMSSAITGLIDGTTTVEEAMSTMFKNIGQAFIDMATQMIAKALVMKALGILFPGASGGGGGHSLPGVEKSAAVALDGPETSTTQAGVIQAAALALAVSTAKAVTPRSCTRKRQSLTTPWRVTARAMLAVLRSQPRPWMPRAGQRLTLRCPSPSTVASLR